jgi:hypothetical protein
MSQEICVSQIERVFVVSQQFNDAPECKVLLLKESVILPCIVNEECKYAEGIYGFEMDYEEFENLESSALKRGIYDIVGYVYIYC